MAHAQKDQAKLIARVKRIQGQLAGVIRALEGGAECAEVLQTAASARGAMNGLMGELIDGHVREHLVGAKDARQAARAGEELLQILRSYGK